MASLTAAVIFGPNFPAHRLLCDGSNFFFS